MDFKKLITISLKDVRITFGDRNLLLIMILAPLALTFIIGAAFSKFIGGTNDLPVEKPKIAIVNEDTGITFPGQPKLSFGDILTSILVPPSDQVSNLPLVSQKLSREDAIAQVDKGKLDAAVIIPADFSSALSPANAQIGQTKITFYRNAGSSIGASIAESIVHNTVNNMLSGIIADFATSHAATNANVGGPAAQQAIAQGVSAQLRSDPPIQVNSVSITGQSAQQTFNPLQYFAPSMAVFFLTFTMAGGVVGIIEERDRGTLQRMLSSPTSRLTILAGKLGGTFLNGLGQLGILIIATSLIAPILGSKASVWGSNIPGIILITLSAVAAAVGLGTLIAGIAKTAQQADTAGNAILILSGILGGSFFNVAQFGGALQNASKLTLNYWATNAYSTLAQSGDITAILPNIAALLIMFVVFFGIGVVLFNRRLDV